MRVFLNWGNGESISYDLNGPDGNNWEFSSRSGTNNSDCGYIISSDVTSYSTNAPYAETETPGSITTDFLIGNNQSTTDNNDYFVEVSVNKLYLGNRGDMGMISITNPKKVRCDFNLGQKKMKVTFI